MCGIAGFVLREGQAEESVLRRMCDQIRHRGPDDQGYHTDGGCGIGMRRLSIIDLATGRQPISNEDQTVWVVFNGEIYNFRDLRRELTARGHCFRTRTDTEVLVHLYEDDGAAELARLRGMFALAVWDARRRRILLARDRFGKKPLYYALLPSGLYFSSELKCLRAAGLTMEVDAEALRLYFLLNYIPDPWSPFRAVRKLPPGSWLTYDDQGVVAQGRFWQVPAPAERPVSKAVGQELAERLRHCFDESVRIRLEADVPLGAFLSGGIDSSLVVASMARQSAAPVKTFSIGFDDAAFNELPWASLLARRYHTEHHEILVRPDSISLVPRLVRHLDEPFGDSSAIPTFLVSEFAARHVKVALSGDGGDELFGGYDSFFRTRRLRWADRIPQPARALMRRVAALLPYSAYGKNHLRALGSPTPLLRYFEDCYAPYFMRRRLLQPDWMLPDDEAFYRSTFGHCLLPGTADILSQALYFETASNLTGDMLVKVDRMSMANSLEVRCPMLDHQLAELAASIPVSLKMGNGGGKQILLQALGDRLPPELLRRPKQGFGVPLAKWFRGELRELLRDHLMSARFLNRGFVTRSGLQSLLDEHDSGRRDNHHWLWALLMLELWFRSHEQSG